MIVKIHAAIDADGDLYDYRRRHIGAEANPATWVDGYFITKDDLEKVAESLVQSYHELNAIRARDGAPIGVSHEYFNTVVETCIEALRRIDRYDDRLHIPIKEAMKILEVDTKPSTVNGEE